MCEYKTILEYSRPDYLKDLNATRACEQGLLTVWLSVETDNGVRSLELSGFEGLSEAVSAMLIADRVIISEEVGTQKEFGSVRIECWDDIDFSEFWCDSVSK